MANVLIPYVGRFECRVCANHVREAELALLSCGHGGPESPVCRGCWSDWTQCCASVDCLACGAANVRLVWKARTSRRPVVRLLHDRPRPLPGPDPSAPIVVDPQAAILGSHPVAIHSTYGNLVEGVTYDSLPTGRYCVQTMRRDVVVSAPTAHVTIVPRPKAGIKPPRLNLRARAVDDFIFLFPGSFYDAEGRVYRIPNGGLYRWQG